MRKRNLKFIVDEPVVLEAINAAAYDVANLSTLTFVEFKQRINSYLRDQAASAQDKMIEDVDEEAQDEVVEDVDKEVPEEVPRTATTPANKKGSKKAVRARPPVHQYNTRSAKRRRENISQGTTNTQKRRKISRKW